MAKREPDKKADMKVAVDRGETVSEMEPLLLREDRDGIALLTLNNPATRNALSEELIATLAGAFDAIGIAYAVMGATMDYFGPNGLHGALGGCLVAYAVLIAMRLVRLKA